MNDEFKTSYLARPYDTYRKDEPKKPPNIRFVPLQFGNTEDDLIAEFENYDHRRNPTHLVYLRYKYCFEKEWTYAVEACRVNLAHSPIWFNDWWEGQEDVEYLAVSWYDAI